MASALSNREISYQSAWWINISEKSKRRIDTIKIDSSFCLFQLWLSVPVNSSAHDGTLPPFYGTILNIRLS